MLKRTCETCGFTEEKGHHFDRWTMEWKGIRAGRTLCRSCYYKEGYDERAKKRKARTLAEKYRQSMF